jgi:signal transduction histidine kinase
MNYLKVCEASAGSEEARAVSEGIRKLMIGDSSGFCFVYQSSNDTDECWFQVRVSRFLNEGALRLVVAHENITEIKRAHDIQEQHNGLLLQARDEERKRIARDLHDVTVQNVATIKAELMRVWKSRGLHLSPHESLEESMSLCDQVIRELRTLSYLLHPPLLDEAGLVPALQWYVRGFVERSGINTEIWVLEDIGRIQPDVETALFRIVQESLTNIHRHSGCRSALIWVTKSDSEVVVRIQDDGHGMPENQYGFRLGPSAGVGILGMRQRLKQIGGRLEIESDSLGTTITARAPISKGESIAYSCGR